MTKLGVHIIGGTSVPLGNPAAIVAADCSVEYIRELRATYPRAAILVRWIENMNVGADPLDEANIWFGLHDGAIMSLRSDPNLYFLGMNEPPDKTAKWFAAFEQMRIRLLHMAGAHAAALALSVGCPDLPIWPTYQPVLDAMDEGDVVSLHEYANAVTDVPASPTDYDKMWHIGRCARPGVYEYLRGKAVYITETGLDEVEGKGGSWKQQNLSPEDYAAFLLRLDGFYQQIPEVKAACVFTLGGHGWEHFDVSPVWPILHRRLAEQSPEFDLCEAVTAARWHVEEATRLAEAWRFKAALDILRKLIDRDSGLLYQIECEVCKR